MRAHSLRRLLWVIDDSHLDAERARAALCDAYEVEVFHDGAQVIERISHGSPPDVLVLDWLMPAVSGLGVLQFVRSMPELKRVSVLVLTAQNNSTNVVTALDEGANDFVSKPFSAAELLARVDALVRSRALIERAELAEQALRSMLDNWSGVLFTVDEHGTVHFANEPAAELLQRQSGDVIGRSMTELLGGDAAAELQRLRHEPGSRDVRVRDRMFEACVRHLVDVGLGTAVITLRDVSEQRRAEEDRRDFYAIVAHDMRSPLFSMLLRTELLMDGAKGPLPPTAIQELRRIKEQIGRMSHLMNDFLDLAQLSEASLGMKPVATDIDALVQDVATEFQPLLSTRELEWRHQGCRSSCAARVDGARLRQAVMNLFVNAANYTPMGGSITTCSQRYEDLIEVSIEDTGPGIEPGELEHVFDRYRRSHSAGETKGTGLGLMIVRRVIEAHGGEVGVESRPGSGSRFWFRIPVDPSLPLQHRSRLDDGRAPGDGPSASYH